MKEIQHKTKRTPEVVDLPNLVEIQLDSYKWFLREGLKELFQSFSPIYDFTGNLSLELLDYTLGRSQVFGRRVPLQGHDHLRGADQSSRAADRRGQGSNRVRGLPWRPAADDRERHFRDQRRGARGGEPARSLAGGLLQGYSRLLRASSLLCDDYSQPGAWIDIETDASDAITVHVAQTKKFPLTTLLRALNLFAVASPETEVLPVAEAMGRTTAAPVVNRLTGEVIYDEGIVVDEKVARKLHGLHIDGVEVEMQGHKTGTTS